MKFTKKYYTIGCCGRECGLCPKYNAEEKTRCPGCCSPNKRGYCKFVNCCVKQKGLETCVECNEYPCEKFKSLPKWIHSVDNFLGKKMSQNLNFIKEQGIDVFLHEQQKRMSLLKIMLERYNEGRSKKAICEAATTLSISDLEIIIAEAEKTINLQQITANNKNTKAELVKELITTRKNNNMRGK